MPGLFTLPATDAPTTPSLSTAAPRVDGAVPGTASTTATPATTEPGLTLPDNPEASSGYQKFTPEELTRLSNLPRQKIYTSTEIALGDGTTVPESEAWSKYQALRTMAVDDPRYAMIKKDVDSYVEERKLGGHKLFPSYTRKEQERQENYLKGLFTRPLDQVLPAESYLETERQASLSSDPEGFRQRSVLRAYMNAVAGREIPGEHFDHIRDAYARDHLGMQGDTSDKAVFQAMRGRYAEDDSTRQKLEGVSQETFIATLHGTKPPDQAAIIAGLPERHRDGAMQQIQANVREARRVKRRLGPMVDRLMAGIAKEEERVTYPDGYRLGGSENFDQLIFQLPDSEQDRQMVMAMLVSRLKSRPTRDSIYIDRFFESVERGGSEAFRRFGDFASATGAALTEASAVAVHGERGRNFENVEFARKVVQFNLDRQQFKQLYYSEGDPLVRATDGYLKKGGILAAGSSWTIPASLLGPAGFMFMAGSMGGSSFNDARIANPEANANYQLGMGLVSGLGQAGMETIVNKVGLKAIAGKLPGVASLMTRAGVTAPLGRAAIGGSVGLATNAVGEYVEEGVQSALDTRLQDAALQLSGISPDTDWKKFLTDWASVAGREQQDTLLAVLPYAIIGAGGGSFTHFKQGKALAANKAMLYAMGVPADKIAGISQAADSAAADKALQDAVTAGLETRTPEERANAIALMREQNVLLEKAGLPRVTPGQDPDTGEQNFVFTDPLTGTEATFPTEEAALEHWEQYAQQANDSDLDLIHDAALTGTPTFLTSSGKASETTRFDDSPVSGMPEMTVEAALKHRTITPEQLASRVQAYALEQGIPLEQAQQDIEKLVIRARRFSEKTQDGQFRHTVQLFKGANVMDVFEEFSEDSFTRALDDGFANGADLVADIRRFEDATGQQLLKSDYRYDGTNRMPLLEALSSLSRAHVLGSVRSGSMPGAVARWVELHTTLYSQTLLAARNIGSDITRAGLLRDAIASGHVSPQLQKLIADSIGIDPESIQRRLENPREETTGQGNGPINKSFSVEESSENQGTGQGQPSTPSEDAGEAAPEPSASTFVANVWNALGDHDELFQFGKDSSPDPSIIAKAVSTPNSPIEGYLVKSNTESGAFLIRFYSSSGSLEIMEAHTDRPYISSLEADSQGKQGGGGSQLYMAALDWIHNNGKTIRDDPGGLSRINEVRRTSNFLASALRWKTTKHLSPHAKQKLPQWTSDDDINLRNLAIKEMENVHQVIPESIHWRFDFAEGNFRDTTGKLLTEDDLRQTVRSHDPGSNGIGLTTLQRAIITNSALRGSEDSTRTNLEIIKESGLPISLIDTSYSLEPLNDRK